MRPYALADTTTYFPEYSPHHQVPVKTEASASPDLLSPSIASLQHFQFKFHPPSSSSSHGSLPSSRHPSEPPALTPNHIYRFGSSSSGYNLMSQSSWPPSPTSSHQLPSGASHSSAMINGSSKYDLGPPPHSLSYGDDYEEVSDLVELPAGSHSSLGGADASASSSVNGAGKHIRRRSSKGACNNWGLGWGHYT